MENQQNFFAPRLFCEKNYGKPEKSGSFVFKIFSPRQVIPTFELLKEKTNYLKLKIDDQYIQKLET